MFGKKKAVATEQNDKKKFQTVLRCTMCTDEQVTRFKDIHTGKFHDVMAAKNESDLEKFRR